MKAEHPLEGLVLDLRNNPGGVLQGAVSVVDAFLSDGIIVYTDGRHKMSKAQFNATKKFSLLGAFGLTRNLWAPDSINYENESSWEANLGVIYKLLNNLSYEIHFAYMDTGDLFTERSSYNDVESIIMVSNQLTMSF